MKDLNPFIKELLFSNDCVILPGFGGFIGNYTPARIDRESHTFYPPVKSISFNSRLSHNDGLLIGKISEKKDMGYSDARNRVEAYIRELRDKLEKGERVHLDDIGHFQLNGEGGVQFEPDNTVNYLLGSYGLSSFTREPVDGYDISRAISRDRGKDPLVIASNRRMIWRAAAAIPFVLALVIVPLKTDLFRSEAGLNPLTRVEFEEIRSAQDALFSEMPAARGEVAAAGEYEQADSRAEDVPAVTGSVNELQSGTKPSEAHTTDVRAAEKQPVTDQPEDQELRTGGGEGVYYLVVGSFADADNATKHLMEVSARGYNAELVKAANGYYRVSAESFGTMEEAKDRLSRLADTFPGIWIWKK